MKKTKYLAPSTKYTDVELEQGFMKASVFVDEEDSENLTIDNQELGAEFNFGEGFGDNTWD